MSQWLRRCMANRSIGMCGEEALLLTEKRAGEHSRIWMNVCYSAVSAKYSLKFSFLNRNVKVSWPSMVTTQCLVYLHSGSRPCKSRRETMACPQPAAAFFYRSLLAILSFCCVVPGIAIFAQAQTLTVLHTFTGGTDGYEPFAGVTLDQQSRVYGTTYQGGRDRKAPA
jgi:hypothetical protein